MSAYNPFSAGSPAENTTRVRRVVTGVDESGQSCFVLDGTLTGKIAHGVDTYVATDVWRTRESPADNDGPLADPLDDQNASVGPSVNGTVFRVLELPPDSDWRFDRDGVEVKPLAFHTTASIDYAVVLSGEIYAVLDTDERLLRQGDVLVQRGTAHSWSNRSNAPCVLAFVLVGGTIPTTATPKEA